jgi:chromosome segregation ATPase
MVMTETNMLGVNSWVDNTQDLEQQQREISEKLHFSRTMAERQQVLALENEIAADYKMVKDLRDLAYNTSIKNKPEIEKLKLETARLISESISIDNESVMLEQALRAKHQELADLRRQIEDAKDLV